MRRRLLVQADCGQADAAADDRCLPGLGREHGQDRVGTADELVGADGRTAPDEQAGPEAIGAVDGGPRSRTRSGSAGSGRWSRAACRGAWPARRHAPGPGPRWPGRRAGRARTRCPRGLPRAGGRGRWAWRVQGGSRRQLLQLSIDSGDVKRPARRRAGLPEIAWSDDLLAGEQAVRREPLLGDVGHVVVVDRDLDAEP